MRCSQLGYTVIELSTLLPPLTHPHTTPYTQHTQPIGYRHCKTVVSGWQKSEVMRHLLSSAIEEEGEQTRRRYISEKFEVYTS